MQTVTIHLDDGGAFIGTVLGRDFILDLAVVKINATGLTPVVFDNSEQLKLGETLIE